MTNLASPGALEDRAPTEADLAAVLTLINACDVEDVGTPDYSLADLAADWTYPRFDLARDGRLLVDPDGTVRAYVAVRQYEPGRRFWVDLYVHPAVRGGDAERWAIAAAEERGGVLAEAPDAALFVYAEEGKLDHAEFDPTAWWIAWDDDEVAGMALASVADTVDVAWISTVAVRRQWRGRGLALVLLRTAFRALAERGLPAAALGVDSENPTGATRLYERAGMRVAKTWVRYQRPVPVPPALTST